MEQSLECSIEVGGDALGAARRGAAESLKFSAELWSIALNKSGEWWYTDNGRPVTGPLCLHSHLHYLQTY